MQPSGYHCVICKGSMPIDGSQSHRLDPCVLAVVANADCEWREQREQTFWCHFECFRRLVDDDSVLYIKEADFPTKGECADEQLDADDAG
jgi:hypothetical protein